MPGPFPWVEHEFLFFSLFPIRMSLILPIACQGTCTKVARATKKINKFPTRKPQEGKPFNLNRRQRNKAGASFWCCPTPELLHQAGRGHSLPLRCSGWCKQRQVYPVHASLTGRCMHIYVSSLAAGAKHPEQNAAYCAFKQGLRLIKNKNETTTSLRCCKINVVMTWIFMFLIAGLKTVRNFCIICCQSIILSNSHSILFLLMPALKYEWFGDLVLFFVLFCFLFFFSLVPYLSMNGYLYKAG